MGWPWFAAAMLCLAALIESARGGPLALVLAAVVTLPVALVRLHALTAAGLIAAGGVFTLLALFRPPIAGLVALAVACYLAGRRHSWQSVLLVAPLAACAALPTARTQAVLWSAVAAVAATVGIMAQKRLESRRRDDQARAIEDTLLAHAARGERARIARELHDVVAHHISMIAVQAETARLATPGMPSEGARKLLAIGDTARTALTEMRRLLGVLRKETDPEPGRRPQPGLDQLNELLDEARRLSPASTRLIVRGTIRPLDPGIELTAYRIVQEALTNARRHAPGSAVDVELDYRDGDLHVRVRDNGPGPPTQNIQSGHGLAGMHERAGMVGGRLSATSGPLGGFVVDAVLPIERKGGLDAG